MRLLLDTHVAIWATRDPERLSVPVRNALLGNPGSIVVSTAAIWEIAIKYPLGRSARPPFTAYEAIFEFENAGFKILDVTAAHAAFVERLPHLHSDPFDRLMLAQAIIENMQFVTYDRLLSRYDVAMLNW